MGRKFLNVVVSLGNVDLQNVSFLRIHIRESIINQLLEKMNSPIIYVCHKHAPGFLRDPCSVDPAVNGPFPTTLPLNSSTTVAIGSVAYGFVKDCPTYIFCDFSQRVPKWDAAVSFPTSFLFPPFGMVTLDGKLYVVGFNFSSNAKTGKMFDPTNQCWEDLSLPNIDKSGSGQGKLFVASADQKMLLLDLNYRVQYEYDPQLSRWNSADYQGLLGHVSRNTSYPITVEEETTIYWLDHNGWIRAFDWGQSKVYAGPIIGLAHEPVLKRKHGIVPLFQLKKGLFCIVWLDDEYSVHLTVLRVSRDASRESSSDPVHRLYVAVMDCFHYPRNSQVMVMVDAAYIL